MVKQLLSVAACTLILTGCSEVSITDRLSTTTDQMHYSVVAGNSTKATEEVMGTLAQDGNAFPIYAYLTDKTLATATSQVSYFEDVLMYYMGTWSTMGAPYYFFPANGYLHFYAYKNNGIDTGEEWAKYIAPTIGTFDSDSQPYPMLNCTIPATIDKQEDLIASKTDNFVAANKGTVGIRFKHLLSQINFGVKGCYGLKITIKDIKINAGLHQEGLFRYEDWTWDPVFENESSSNPKNPAADYIYMAGNTLSTKGSEIVSNDPPIEGEDKNIYVFGDGGQFGPETSDIENPLQNRFLYLTTGTNPGWNTSTAVKGDGLTVPEALMLMPQILAGKTFAFTYKITDMNGVLLAEGTVNDAPLCFQGTLPTKEAAPNMQTKAGVAGCEWLQSKRYLYLIDFSNFLDDNKIHYDVTMDEWINWNADQPGGFGQVDIIGGSLVTQPSEAIIEALPAFSTVKFAGAILNQKATWDFSSYVMSDPGFAAGVDGGYFMLDFSETNFNDSIMITPPTGFTMLSHFNTASSTWAKAVTAACHDDQVLTLVRPYATAAKLEADAGNSARSKTSLVYGGTDNVDLATISTLIENRTEKTLFSGATITITFTGTGVPASTTVTNWTWDATNKIARYTHP